MHLLLLIECYHWYLCAHLISDCLPLGLWDRLPETGLLGQRVNASEVFLDVDKLPP